MSDDFSGDSFGAKAMQERTNAELQGMVSSHNILAFIKVNHPVEVRSETAPGMLYYLYTAEYIYMILLLSLMSRDVACPLSPGSLSPS